MTPQPIGLKMSLGTQQRAPCLIHAPAGPFYRVTVLDTDFNHDAPGTASGFELSLVGDCLLLGFGPVLECIAMSTAPADTPS